MLADVGATGSAGGSFDGFSPADRAPAAVDVRSCAEEVLALLRLHGTDVLFLNPGTDSAPLQEAAASLRRRGVPIPRIVTSTFEAVALAAAHGFWQVTRRPQAVFVHVDVGTQNLGAMVHNVLRDRAGVVVLAGRTPYGEDSLAMGGRSSPIHWQQDVPDQAGIVRPYAKWCAELTRAHDTARVVGRAVQVAAGGRPGLAYVTLPRDVLMADAGPAALRRTWGWALPTPAAPEPRMLAKVAELLAGAEHPVIVTSRVGRDVRAVEALRRLAELVGVPVVGRPEAVNLPTDHPLLCRSQAVGTKLLEQADLVLVVSCDVPWIPARQRLAPNCVVVHVDPDPVRADMPLWTFPADCSITADPGLALSQLADLMEVMGDGFRNEWARRSSWLRQAAPAPAPDRALAPVSTGLGVVDVVGALNKLLGPEDIVVEETASNTSAVVEALDRTLPGTLLSAGGPGLGWALGASVGIAMASGRRVVAVVGDGAFLFGSPVSALALAAEVSVPFLTVVLDNDGYRASRRPVLELFPQGASAEQGVVVGTSFAHPPDQTAVARACGAFGETVADGLELLPALRRGLQAVDQGRCAVVTVRIAQR
jgi:acetolactate synthase-1/2/3 large subunit